MITNGEGWLYLPIKKLSALSKWITWKHDSGFYCLNFPHFFGTENKFNDIIKIFCNIVMPSKNAQILKFNQYKKSDQAPLMILIISIILMFNRKNLWGWE